MKNIILITFLLSISLCANKIENSIQFIKVEKELSKNKKQIKYM